MISANSFVFPRPYHNKIPSQFQVSSSLNQRHIINIPKICQPPLTKNNHEDRNQIPTARSMKISVSVKDKQQKKTSNIPCLFLEGPTQPKKLIIYFHGNAEDIIKGYDLLKSINQLTGRSVLAVEYPGYSFYSSKEDCSAKIIQEDSINVIEYMKKQKGYKFENMTIMGRSIGSGVAIFLASKFRVGNLILVSPFLSLCEVVKDKYCNAFSLLLEDRFNNRDRISKVKCPCLIIHGLADEIIPYHHSISLNSIVQGFCMLKLVKDMTHSCFHYYKDFLVHVNEFFYKLDV